VSYYRVYSAGAKIDNVIIQILKSLISLGLNFHDMTQIQKLIPIKFPIQQCIILVHLEKFLILLLGDIIKTDIL